MKLSIIIVNYNVKFFLSQCLNSVKLAIDNLTHPVEVFVVDNHSVDGSCFLIKDQFPWVKLMENKENVGFSKANNQAIKIAQGEFILLLNPDTVLEQDTLKKVIEFMESHADAGGLGVRMIDGKGKFLPESKRGLPTPKVAFYKISGLSKIFSKSKQFNRYHLGYLNEFEINEVDVLSGAFMLIRKEVFNKIGLLDETFFMYGEDVDLSYRITLAGYKNYYFPETTIIHYKGESTKKGSINYVKMFYSAMAIFANKHFRSRQSHLMSFFIQLAIWLRAFISLIKRLAINIAQPFFDFLFFYLILFSVTQFWQHVKYHGEGIYPEKFIWYVLPLYTFLLVFAQYYFGSYEKRPRWSSIFKGLGFGILLLLSLYALLGEDLRYSRAIVILGLIAIFIFYPFIRFIAKYLNLSEIGSPKRKRAVIVGSFEEYKRTMGMLNSSLVYESISWVSINNGTNEEALGPLADLPEIVDIHKINEIIFCSKDIAPKTIIEQMTRFTSTDIDYKIVGDAIIGSKTVYSDEPTFEIFINSIVQPINKRNKRLLDISLSLLILIISPVLLFLTQNKMGLFRNIFLVLLGQCTWVGYATPVKSTLPKIKSSVIPIAQNVDNVDEINFLYSKDYKVTNDLIAIYKNYKLLGQMIH